MSISYGTARTYLFLYQPGYVKIPSEAMSLPREQIELVEAIFLFPGGCKCVGISPFVMSYQKKSNNLYVRKHSK